MKKVIKGSHLVKTKDALLESTNNAAGIVPFFYGAVGKSDYFENDKKNLKEKEIRISWQKRNN